MMRRREKEKNIYEFSLIISLESLINQSVWGWGGVLSVTPVSHLLYLSLHERGPCGISERWVVCFHLCVGELFFL